jgi:hypothetical protein
MRFTRGQVVHARHFQHDDIAGFFLLRVVEHDDRGLLMFLKEGSIGRHPRLPDGRRMRETPLREWATTRKQLTGVFTHDHDALIWNPAGADYGIRLFFRDGVFLRWYANLELPGVAWRDGDLAGYGTVDWDLDVVIEPDRTWAIKDEEEFTGRLAEPELYWAPAEERVRAAARDVIALAETGAFPFDGAWTDFAPPADWTPLTPADLPPGWDRPRAC